MDHNKIDTLQLAWAVTSGKMKIKFNLFSSGYLGSLIDVI